jgi:lipoate-protein ligase B
VAIGALAAHSVSAETVEGLTGVWTGGCKIASIGVHVSRGVTTHGLAVNVNNDLQPFEWIVPCGIEGCRVTSLSREQAAQYDLQAFGTVLAERFAEIYGRRAVPVDPEAIGLSRPSLEIA